jgi:murein L,D-transpeptidase YcbB/YkuD
MFKQLLYSSTVTLLLTGCVHTPNIPAPSVAERADSIQRVFETPEPYTPRRLDSLLVLEFLKGHPEFTTDSAGVMDFYRRREFQPAWFHGDSLGEAAITFLQLIGSIDTSGMKVATDLHALSREVNALIERADTLAWSDSLIAITDLSLTARFFRVAETKYGGFVQRDLRELDWYIPRRKKNYELLLDSLVAGVTDLSPIEPLHPQYRLLKEQLRRHAALDTFSWPPLDVRLCDGKHPEPPDSSGRALRERLFLLGDLASNDGSNGLDSVLRGGIISAQQRFGMKETGMPDADLLAALNVPIAERMRTILLNMERLRWMPQQPGPERIEVNIPEFRLHVYEADTLAWEMDVVVGAEATHTVIFNGLLTQVVFAPYWNIPQSIIRKEILPAVKRSVGYLDRKRMEVVMGGKVVSARSIKWDRYTNGVPFTIRQRPGPGNALGQVKFLFPNQHSIYLHDTPSKEKFAHRKRAFSHGCIRLSQPRRLAEYLLASDTLWNDERISKAMIGTTEQVIPIASAVPVTLTYFTAWVDRAGRMQFRDDVYGHDAHLSSELFGTGQEQEDVTEAP